MLGVRRGSARLPAARRATRTKRDRVAQGGNATNDDPGHSQVAAAAAAAAAAARAPGTPSRRIPLRPRPPPLVPFRRPCQKGGRALAAGANAARACRSASPTISSPTPSPLQREQCVLT
ncbi:hypothetical protein PLESTM_001337100 [Pleodorina starrii]|nr:hypothetical protein PLESTM_001337100 [Pleodorina starrii]